MMRRKFSIGGRSRHNLYFKQQTIDFNTQYLLGYANGQGAALGEVLQAIAQVDESDLESWVRAWGALADRTEHAAAGLLAAGHGVSAREALLRAAAYHRAVTFCLGEDDLRIAARVRGLQGCFARAAALFEPAFEQVRIPHGERTLPGSWLRPDADPRPRPTLIMIGGGETYHEELYFWTGEAGRRRGWNVLLVDLPGQGSTFLDGMIFEPDTERALGAIVDALLPRPEVDPRRIVALGVSLGGYLVLRAASVERRLAAIAVSTPMPSVRDWLLDAVPMRIDRLPPRLLEALFRLLMRLDPSMKIGFEKWFRRLGVRTFGAALAALDAWRVDLAAITCPVLCLLGEGEAPTFHSQTERAVQALGPLATLRVTTVQEGADGHCQSNNFPVLQQLVFDWFEERLRDRA